MVLSRGLVISLGVSALGCTLLFLYFRNKITAVEKKVDIMFDLIQNHQSQQQNMVMQNMRENITEENIMTEETENQGGAWADESNSQPDLIQVSEDEDDDDDDDSEEISDSEDDEEEEEVTQKLSLAKTEDMTLEINDVKKIVVQESIGENTNINDIEPEDITDSLDEIDVDEDDEDEDDEDDEDHKDGEDIVVAKLDEEFDYTKLKVSELKSLAAAKKLEGYKSLKKGPLIELLKSSE
jgi:hypothetical protein